MSTTSCSMSTPCHRIFCSYCNASHPANKPSTNKLSILKMQARTRQATEWLRQHHVPLHQTVLEPPIEFLHQHGRAATLQVQLTNQDTLMRRLNIAPPPNFYASVAPTRLIDLRHRGSAASSPLSLILAHVIRSRWSFKNYSQTFYSTVDAEHYIAIVRDLLFSFIQNRWLFTQAEREFRKMITLQLVFNEYTGTRMGYAPTERLLFNRDPEAAVANWTYLLEKYLTDHAREVALRITLGAKTSESVNYHERHSERLANALELIPRLRGIFPAAVRFRVELFVPSEHDGRGPAPWYVEKIDLKKPAARLSEVEKPLKGALVMLVTRMQQRIRGVEVLVRVRVEDDGSERTGRFDGIGRSPQALVDRMVQENGVCHLVAGGER